MLETELVMAAEKDSRRLMVVLHGLGDSMEGASLAAGGDGLPVVELSLGERAGSLFRGVFVV